MSYGPFHRVDLRVRAEDVVVGKDVGEPELLDVPRVTCDRAGLVADLGLGKYDSDLHPRIPALLGSAHRREPRLHFGDALDRVDGEDGRFDIDRPAVRERLVQLVLAHPTWSPVAWLGSLKHIR